MSATFNTRLPATWLSRPTAAVTASLVAVTFFIALLGIAFLPTEARRLIEPHFVSVTHCLEIGSGRSAISLFWTIPQISRQGRQHHLAIYSPGATQPAPAFPWRELKPQSLANGPDADHILVGNWDGAIYSLNVTRLSDEPTCIGRQASGGVIALASSADGRFVVSQSGFGLYAWDVSTHSERWRRDDVAPYCFALRCDSRTAILGNLDSQLIEIDLESGRTLKMLTCFDRQILAISLSADGSALAVLRADGRLLLLDGHTAAPLWEAKFQPTCLTASGRFAIFSPNGELLVTASQDGGATLAVWDVATGQRLQELRGHRKVVHGAAFATSGELRSWGADGTIRAWNLGTGAMQQVAELAPPPKAT